MFFSFFKVFISAFQVSSLAEHLYLIPKASSSKPNDELGITLAIFTMYPKSDKRCKKKQ